MIPGDLVLARLMQADGQSKLRPAVLLCPMPPFGDWLMCGVSSQLQHFQPGFDEMLDPSMPDFAATRLNVPSIVRLGFLSTLPPRQIRGAAGRISPERLARLRQKLAQHISGLPPRP